MATRSRADWVLPTSMLLGTFAWSFIYVSLPFHLLGSSLLLGALGAMGNVWSFGALRFLQVLCIAPIFPLVGAAIAQRASGEAIGFVNSARIGAAFIGPVAATTSLSSMPPAAVYLVLAALGLSVVPLVARLDRRSRLRDDPGEV